MDSYKILSTRWRLSLLFFFILSSFISSAYAETIGNKVWGKPLTLASTALELDGITSVTSQPHPNNSQPKIITNENDKAFAVWTQYDSVGDTDTTRIDVKYSLWSAYFDGENWSSPMRIKGVNPSEKTTVPEIIFDGNGDVLATWTESTRIDRYRFTSPIVLASRFDSRNLDWSNPTQLTYEDLAIHSLKIASRNNGIIHIIWEQQSTKLDGAVLGSNVSLWSSVFNGSSWNNPTKIYETPTFEEYRTKSNPIFSNYNNDLMSVYLVESNDDYTMGAFASHFNGSNWSTPQRLGSDAIFANDIKASFDKNGNAIAVWREITADYRELFLASHFNRSSRTWSPAVLIAEDKSGYSPQIAFSDNGYAFVVWTGHTPGEVGLWASQFNGSNWGVPFLIDSVPWRGGTIEVRDVTLDNSNYMHVAWLKTSKDNNSNLWTNSFNFDGSPRSTAKSIDVGKYEIIDTPSDIPLKKVVKSGVADISMDGNGNAHALGANIVQTWTREEPNSSSPWKETKTKTIWTSQLKESPPIHVQRALVYMPYGGLVIILGEGFTDVIDEATFKKIKLIDENGNAPVLLYVWRDDLVLAHFENIPESVTMTNLNGTIKTMPLEIYE